jgi:dynein heavy chain
MTHVDILSGSWAATASSTQNYIE